MINKIKSALQTVDTKNGCLFNISRVVEGTDIPARGVGLIREDGKIEIKTNAEGPTETLLRDYILVALIAAGIEVECKRGKMIVATENSTPTVKGKGNATPETHSHDGSED
jgi:hypothetical protein